MKTIKYEFHLNHEFKFKAVHTVFKSFLTSEGVNATVTTDDGGLCFFTFKPKEMVEKEKKLRKLAKEKKIVSLTFSDRITVVKTPDGYKEIGNEQPSIFSIK